VPGVRADAPWSSTGAWFFDVAQPASNPAAITSAAQSLVSIERFFVITIGSAIPYSLSNEPRS